jgi:hypothetical protein
VMGDTGVQENKNMSIKTVEMELAVANFMYKKGAEAVISKTNFLYYEADILSVTKSHYLTEVELKVSKSDFMADFKKSHKHDSKLTKYLYYSVPTDLVELAKEKLSEDVGILEVYRPPWNSKAVRCKTVRDAKIRSNKPLTDKQVINLYRLGCYKEWVFKAKQK